MPKKTVLVVDDENLIRELLLDALSEEFNVLLASNGEEALKLYAQNQDKIDVVITDLIMPKLHGDALAENLRKLHPSVPIVFISGYEHQIEIDKLLNDGRAAFLPKPFDIMKLTSTLKAILA